MQHDYNGFPNQDRAELIAAKYPGKAEVVRHREHRLLMPIFSAQDPVIIRPDDVASVMGDTWREPVLRDLDTNFDLRLYGEGRRPVSLGKLGTHERLSYVQPLPEYAQHVLDMPIKFPDMEIRLPRELESLRLVLQHIADTERALNPRYDRYYAYLSLQQGMVKAGTRHRENPYHVDGFQGPRWPMKHPVNHSYLLTDALPTVFYPRPFPLDEIDPSFDDIYAEFGRVIESNPGPTWRPEPHELLLMDAYCVHRGDVAPVDTWRTWIRVSWETRIFDRLGNTHNPCFDYDWEMVARDTDPRIKPRVIAATQMVSAQLDSRQGSELTVSR